MSNNLVIGIDTSHTMCSIAWWIEDKILLEYNKESLNNHATVLPKLLSEGLKTLRYKPSDIGLICVTSGPGSFTGLRIGMAYAKGLCFGLNKPIMALTNFEILALQAPMETGPIYTIIDARRGNVYLGSFLKDNKTLSETSVVPISNLKDMLFSQSIVVIHDTFHLDDHLFDGYEGKILYSKFDIGLLCKFGYHKYRKGDRIDLAMLEPLYIQQFAGME